MYKVSLKKFRPAITNKYIENKIYTFIFMDTFSAVAGKGLPTHLHILLRNNYSFLFFFFEEWSMQEKIPCRVSLSLPHYFSVSSADHGQRFKKDSTSYCNCSPRQLGAGSGPGGWGGVGWGGVGCVVLFTGWESEGLTHRIFGNEKYSDFDSKTKGQGSQPEPSN